MKRALTRPTIRWATGFVLLAAAILAWWRITDADWFDDWVANVVVGLVTVAVTITLVESIVRRENERRQAPRLDRLERMLRNEVEGFCEIVAFDYEHTHVKTFVPIPKGMLAFLEQWAADKPGRDAASHVIAGTPAVLHIGFELERSLRLHRAEDEAVMPPEIVRAIDDFHDAADTARVLSAFSDREEEEDAADSIRRAEEALVTGAHAFGEALVRWRRQPLEFTDNFVGAIEANHIATVLRRPQG